MGKKMRLPFLSKSSQTSHSWPWPSCSNPKTLSFRATDDIFMKTANPAYIEPTQCHVATCDVSRLIVENGAITQLKGDSCHDRLVHEQQRDSLVSEPDSVLVIGELRLGDRLIFDHGESRSILEEGKSGNNIPFEESVALVMDSQDPYFDFRKSMDEMVEAHCLKDWESLEKLLNWFLKVNDENNHGYVIEAFVDLLVEINFSNLCLGGSNVDDDDDEHEESTSTCSNSMQFLNSPLSFSFSTSMSTSPCLSSLELLENDGHEKLVDSGCSH